LGGGAKTISWAINLLACMEIILINPFNKKPLFKEDQQLRDEEGNVFPLSRGAFRLVPEDNYTESFGFQWNKFAKTQVDRFQVSSNQSKDRFFSVTKWDEQDLSGKNILEVGSGAGRFSQIVLQHTNAELYSVDYSNAVEANFKNNGHDTRLHLFQASIYDLPFAPEQFDKVFCFGVLQHTPDFKRSVECLAEMVKPGGELVIDFYPVKGWYTKIHAKYLLRPFTRKMSHQRLLSLIEINAGWLIAAYRFFDRLGIGKLVNRFLPICDINTTIPHSLDKSSLREWVILDTFDMFSPTYDNPQKMATVVNWLKSMKLSRVSGEAIQYGDGNEVFAVKAIK
jgi:2-polyprenyl-3-methyl-5-hydroxy-6-metoxy-1,4-benzoquinol methylase